MVEEMTASSPAPSKTTKSAAVAKATISNSTASSATAPKSSFATTNNNATSRSKTPPPPVILGMLVDRTSFDETDDYGVDRQSLESSLWTQKLNTPPTTVMKNGKVRRRLRWRPKRNKDSANTGGGGGGGGGEAAPTRAALASSLASKGGPLTNSNNTAAGAAPRGRSRQQSYLRSQSEGGSRSNRRSTTSSNGSVVSTSSMSHVSKESHKSAHSFASTETFKKNNTKNADFHARGYPLPRPNYPNTFDGVSTIINEGNMVHARKMGSGAGHVNNNRAAANNISANTNNSNDRTRKQQQQRPEGTSPQTVFAAAHLNNAQKQQMPPLPQNAASPKQQQQQHLSAMGFPPRCGNTSSSHRLQRSQGSGSSSSSLIKVSNVTAPPLRSRSSLRSASSTVTDSNNATTTLGDVPLPSLETEDLLSERRVDLRIPSPAERRQAGNDVLSREHSFASSTQRAPSPLASSRVRSNDDCKSVASSSSVSMHELRPTSAADAAASALDSQAALEEQLAMEEEEEDEANGASLAAVQDNVPMVPFRPFRVKRGGSGMSASVLEGHEDDDNDTTATDDDDNASDDKESVERNMPISPVAQPPHHAVVHQQDEREIRFCMSDMTGGISRTYSEPQQHHTMQPQQHQLQRSASSVGGGRGGGKKPRPSRGTASVAGHERARPPRPLSKSTSPPPSPPSPVPMTKTAPSSPSGADSNSSSPKGSAANQTSSTTEASATAASRTQQSSSPSSTVPVDLDDGSFLDAEKNLMAICEMAEVHLRHCEYAEALEVFEEILRGQLTRYGEDHYRVGTALHNIGIVHMKRGDYQEAVQVCREAVRIRRAALNPDHPDVAVSLSQLGVAYLECRKHKRAIVSFREALRIRRHNLGPKHPKVAKILNNIGCALYELNELEVAKVAFEEALEIQRETLRDMPFDDTEEVPDHSLLSIASTLSNIGSIKLYWGLVDEASIDLEEALLIQQSVLGDEHPLAQRTEESLDWIDTVKHSDQAIDDNNSVAADPLKSAYYPQALMMCASPIQASTTADAEEQQSEFPGMIICSRQGGLSPRNSSNKTTPSPNVDNDAGSAVAQNTSTSTSTTATITMPSIMCAQDPSEALVLQSDDEKIRGILAVMERNLTKLRTGLGLEGACGGDATVGGSVKDSDAASTCNLSTVSEQVLPAHYSI